MTISILTIGDEICIGQIVNTNSAWMAEQCARIGCTVLQHSAVGDDLPMIIAEFERLSTHSDAVLMTGGLGPTHDDRTKSAFLTYFEDTLILHEHTLHRLEHFFEQRGRELTQRNRDQALQPSKCEVLDNDTGTAPGMLMVAQKPNGRTVLFVSMPGIPYEMKHLMERHVLPRLKELSATDAITLHKTLLTNGIVESTLADYIGHPDKFLAATTAQNTLAFLPSSSGVRLRISVKASTRATAEAELERIETYLRSRVGRYIYGENSDTLSQCVGRKLLEHGRTLAVAESCTAGLLGASLTDMAGSSAYFMGGMQTYSNASKVQLLHVPEALLNEYGAVSAEVAECMAQNVCRILNTSYGISITGIAGPDGGTETKPVGLVFIGIATPEDVFVHRFVFGMDRQINRERAVAMALSLLLKKLLVG
jgi:nicotinamide-nucleotide amidase